MLTSVYYAIRGTEADEGGFRQILRSVTSFKYAGFVASCRLLNGPKVSNLDSAVIAELANRICMVLVSAFDRERVSHLRKSGPSISCWRAARARVTVPHDRTVSRWFQRHDGRCTIKPSRS